MINIHHTWTNESTQNFSILLQQTKNFSDSYVFICHSRSKPESPITYMYMYTACSRQSIMSYDFISKAKHTSYHISQSHRSLIKYCFPQNTSPSACMAMVRLLGECPGLYFILWLSLFNMSIQKLELKLTHSCMHVYQ